MTRTDDTIRSAFTDLAATAAPPDRLLSWLDDLAAEASRQPAQRPPRRRRSGRVWLPLLGGAVTASVLAVVAILIPTGSHLGGVAQADPVQVLTAARTYAQSLPYVAPRADQYYYVRQDGRESWMSVDGTHDGEILPTGGTRVVIPGCRNGVALTGGNYVGLRPQPCTPDPAFLADAPTTEAGMAAYLATTYGNGVNAVGKGIYDMLQNHFLRPAALGALFQATTHLNGLRVISEATLGEHIIGVAWSSDPATQPTGRNDTVLLFNAITHAYLGLQTTGLNGEKGGGLNGPTHVAIVNSVGQRA